jgi:hypothetical protein
LPTKLFKNGIFIVSIKGDHKNFKAYGVPARANKPIEVKLKPESIKRADIVAPINGKGSPAQKPNGINAKILYLLYGPNLDRTVLYI